MTVAAEADRINAHLKRTRPVYVWFRQGNRERVIAARAKGKKLEVMCLGSSYTAGIDKDFQRHRTLEISRKLTYDEHDWSEVSPGVRIEFGK